MLVSEARRLQWKLISANCYCKTSNNGIQTSLLCIEILKQLGFTWSILNFWQNLFYLYIGPVCAHIYSISEQWVIYLFFFFIVKSVQNNFKTEDCRFIITTFWNFSSTDSGRAGELRTMYSHVIYCLLKGLRICQFSILIWSLIQCYMVPSFIATLVLGNSACKCSLVEDKFWVAWKDPRQGLSLSGMCLRGSHCTLQATTCSTIYLSTWSCTTTFMNLILISSSNLQLKFWKCTVPLIQL